MSRNTYIDNYTFTTQIPPKAETARQFDTAKELYEEERDLILKNQEALIELLKEKGRISTEIFTDEKGRQLNEQYATYLENSIAQIFEERTKLTEEKNRLLVMQSEFALEKKKQEAEIEISILKKKAEAEREAEEIIFKAKKKANEIINNAKATGVSKAKLIGMMAVAIFGGLALGVGSYFLLWGTVV